MEVVVARQAIFDSQRKLYGYELLFRPDAASNQFDGTEAAAATMQVLANTLMSAGAETLLGGKKAFVNFDHNLLAKNMYLALPRQSLVIEILETVAPTADLVALCEGIRKQGYTLALDDFADAPAFAPLAQIAQVIKVDLRLSSREEQVSMLGTYKPRGVQMLAEKVETYEEFEWARRAGYDLFQGYFFARPEIVRSQDIPPMIATCLRLLREVQQPELDFRRLERLIREDVSLTYKLLRYANSALFKRGDIRSIHAALVALGEDHIRRWVTLATLPKLATNKPGELLTLSLVRAHFCERLAELAGAASSNQAFLVGMFSLLDALIDQPLEEVLRKMDLGKNVTQAVLGTGPQNDLLTALLQVVCCYERGDWGQLAKEARHCGISTEAIGEAYLDSTAWAEQVMRSARA
ncbi:MAG: HDOD domain-containing protein [Acidobacteriota bacterium]|nr:HDOD domain-containing protein [Acidobacteriota bacterium]